MDGKEIHAVFMRDFAQSQSSLHESMHQALRAIRNHLDMDVAFVSEFRDGKRWFVAIDQRRGQLVPLEEGGSDPLNEALCHHIAVGNAPQMMLHAAADPIALAVPALIKIPVGVHVSVPILNGNGEVFGMLCCFSRATRPRVSQRDMRLVRTFADIIGSNIAILQAMNGPTADLRTELATLLTAGRIEPVFQPICELQTGRVAGYEALSRFPDLPNRAVDEVFDSARRSGLGVELELQAARRIMRAIANAPLRYGYISINFSYRTLICDAINAMYENDCKGLPQPGYIIEISEQEAVDNFDTLRATLSEMRAKGLKIAVDDVGAGQSGLKHLLQLEPDMIKLDRSVTAGLTDQREARAMVAAMQGFARETGADLVAEGIETAEQAKILTDLGVTLGQGFWLGRPEPLTRLKHRT